MFEPNFEEADGLGIRNNATIKMMSSLFSVKKWVPVRILTFSKLGRMALDLKLDASFHTDDKKLSWRKFGIIKAMAKPWKYQIKRPHDVKSIFKPVNQVKKKSKWSFNFLQ